MEVNSWQIMFITPFQLNPIITVNGKKISQLSALISNVHLSYKVKGIMEI